MEDCVSRNEFEVDGASYYAEPLHKKPNLINDCCDLINLEWKRSFAARKRSIEGSSENFPMSLLLLKKDEDLKVVGHCKISKLPLWDRKVFVETVVIDPKLRGKGLGTFLMKEVEEVARRKDIQWIYLSTQGQQPFYEKLGYLQCPPVGLYGSAYNDPNEKPKDVPQKINWLPSFFTSQVKTDEKSTPPPPPLPQINVPIKAPNVKTFMRKEIKLL